MKITTACIVVGAAAVSLPALAQATITRYALNIPREPLDQALKEFAQQTGLQVARFSDVTHDTGTTGPVVGNFTTEQALSTLLAGSGLAYRVLADRIIAIVPRQLNASGSSAGGPLTQTGAVPDTHDEKAQGSFSSRFRLGQADVGANQGASADTSSVKKASATPVNSVTQLEEVVVTGTLIRGIEPTGSPLKIYSRDDIDQSGAATLDQFARDMTENFSGADPIANGSSSAQFGRLGTGTADNAFGGAAFDIHGLGTTATLTLLNGHRIAPAGVNGLLTDVSQIPLSAIDHIEVLADGASAIYGADAVGGVVNIVTRRDFSGAGTSVRDGAATAGGDHEFTGSQLLGTAWDSGSALLDYEYDRQGGLDASERSWIPGQGGPDTLIPGNRRNDLFASGDQDLWAGGRLSVQLLYGGRDFSSNSFQASAPLDLTYATGISGKVTQSGATAAIDSALGSDWSINLTENYSRLIQDQAAVNAYDFGGSATTGSELTDVTTSVLETDALVNGSLVSLPSGQMKAALGAGLRTEKFDQSVLTINGGSAAAAGVPELKRQIGSAYGELYVPLVSPDSAFWGAKRLEISAAVRYDHYSDFGSSTNPKFGVLWKPLTSLDLRATFGRSFRAPPLSQLATPVFSYTELLPYPSAPDGAADTLYVTGGNPMLRPETSKTATGGFTFRPQSIQNFALSASYFHTRFNSRIESPQGSLGTSLTDPALAPFITLNPSLALVQSYFDSPGFVKDYVGLGPAAVEAVLDSQIANIASTKQSGIDFSMRYELSSDFGNTALWITGTRLLENAYQPVYSLPYFSLLNSFAEPLAWKLRGGVNWSRSIYYASVTLNYLNAYENSQFTPAQRIASWTTLDVGVGLRTLSAASGILPPNFTVGLWIQNLTDREPPYVAASPTNYLPGVNPPPYDAANASPVGRFIAIQLTKKWGN